MASGAEAELRTGRFPAWLRRGKDELLTLLRFAAVGGVATFIHMGMAGLLIGGLGLPVLTANLLAFLTAFLFSFGGHFLWTFRGRASLASSLWRFCAIASAAFFVNNLVLLALVKSGVLGDIANAIIAAAVVPFVSYTLSRLWGFRDKR